MKLSALEKFRVRLFRLDKDVEKFDNFLLRDATETEKMVYKNMKLVNPETLENLAKSAIERLDSKNEKERVFGAGEIAEMKEHDCYIGDWVFGGYVWHRWLPECKRLINPDQLSIYRKIEENIFRFPGLSCDFGEKNTQVYFQGKDYMTKELGKLGINFTTIEK